MALQVASSMKLTSDMAWSYGIAAAAEGTQVRRTRAVDRDPDQSKR